MIFDIEKAKTILSKNYRQDHFNPNKIWVEYIGKDLFLFTLAGSCFYDGSLVDPKKSGILINPEDIDYFEY